LNLKKCRRRVQEICLYYPQHYWQQQDLGGCRCRNSQWRQIVDHNYSQLDF
jgi:hypothetical protein